MVKEERGSKIYLRGGLYSLVCCSSTLLKLHVPIINWKLSKREEEPTPMSQFVKGHLEKHKPYNSCFFALFYLNESTLLSHKL